MSIRRRAVLGLGFAPPVFRVGRAAVAHRLIVLPRHLDGRIFTP